MGFTSASGPGPGALGSTPPAVEQLPFIHPFPLFGGAGLVFPHVSTDDALCVCQVKEEKIGWYQVQS